MSDPNARRDRRKQPRHELHPEVAYMLGAGPLEFVYCRDISLGGMFLETSSPPPFGAKVRVYVWLPDKRGLVHTQMEGTVRWISKDGFGIQFGLMGARETHAIVSYIHGASWFDVPHQEVVTELEPDAIPEDELARRRKNNSRVGPPPLPPTSLPLSERTFIERGERKRSFRRLRLSDRYRTVRRLVLAAC